MKILAIADAPPKESVKSIIEKYPIEAICLLGDLNIFSLAELKEIKHIPKIGVYGNHCSGTYFEPLGVINLHLKTIKLGQFVFGGFEGSVKYKDSSYGKMYSQEEAFELLKNFPYVDVMLAHSPPYGINDEPNDRAHQGFKALRRYLEEKKPRYFLHGHTFPTSKNLITKFMDTKIIFVFRDKIVDLI